MATFMVRTTPKPQRGRCRGCSQPIWWLITQAGKPMCLDSFTPASDPTADLVAVDSGQTHWSTCVAREQFTRKKVGA